MLADSPTQKALVLNALYPLLRSLFPQARFLLIFPCSLLAAELAQLNRTLVAPRFAAHLRPLLLLAYTRNRGACHHVSNRISILSHRRWWERRLRAATTALTFATKKSLKPAKFGKVKSIRGRTIAVMSIIWISEHLRRVRAMVCESKKSGSEDCPKG